MLFRYINRYSNYSEIKAALCEAREAGLTQVKLNLSESILREEVTNLQKQHGFYKADKVWATVKPETCFKFHLMALAEYYGSYVYALYMTKAQVKETLENVSEKVVVTYTFVLPTP